MLLPRLVLRVHGNKGKNKRKCALSSFLNRAEEERRVAANEASPEERDAFLRKTEEEARIAEARREARRQYNARWHKENKNKKK